MMLTHKIAIILLLGIAVSCSNNTEESKTTQQVVAEKAFTEESLDQEIKNLEKELAQPNVVNPDEIRRQLIEFYSSFVKTFSTSKAAPDYLFKAGNESVNLKKYNNALGFYDRIDQHYPSYIKRPESLFIQGFIYDSYKNEFGKAKEKYERLIELYPNHLLAEQAKQSIGNLGLTDEEIINKFNQQNQ